MERLVALYAACGGLAPVLPADVYVVAVGAAAERRAFSLVEELRDSIEGIRIELNLGGGSFKAQLKRADKSNATYALILGEQELADGNIGLKPLRSADDQLSVAMHELAGTLAARLA
jgi:histidyl-tRNA synthetase